MINFREKYVKEYLETLKANYSKLTDWERGFYESVKNLEPANYQGHQFNKLKEIAEELRKKDNE
ncbi:MAG: hypothetical protein RDU14_16970 [Melioribacteraceae bacterium]|nr:hypothetical protein [Melioribacteraceae bacterium]